NLEVALKLDVPHLSCYALTIEPKTALKKFIEKGIVPPVDEDVAKQHYEILLSETEKAGLENYEFSNFGKPGFHSHNNTAFWEAKPYLGIGPSAHSYDGKSRSWNVANNTKYIKSIEEGILPSEEEILSKDDIYNEYIMTGSRTKKNVSEEKVKDEFGKEFLKYHLKQARIHFQNNLIIQEHQILKNTKKGNLLGNG